MAVTPKGIVTPDPSSPYNLVTDLNTLASTADAAIVTQKGTSSQRTAAMAGAPEGTLWQDTDGIKMIWRKDGAAWVPAVFTWAGTTTQMNGFTQAPSGFLWINTSDSIEYLRAGGAWTTSSIPHTEFSSSVSIGNSVDGNLGTLTVDAARSTSTALVTSPSAGRIRLQPGIYSITLVADMPAQTTGLTLLGLRVSGAGAFIGRNSFPSGSSSGLMFSIASYRVMSANTDLEAYFFQTSGATRTVPGRVVVSRIG